MPGPAQLTVYAHFPNRDTLLEAVVERAVQRTMALFDDAQLDNGGALECLERLILLAWRELDAHHGRVQAALQQLSPAALTHPAAEQVNTGQTDGTSAATVTGTIRELFAGRAD